MSVFHEVLFPARISLGATGGPERRTEIVTLGSGHEARNTPWAASRRRYDAGLGLASLDDVHAVIGFFEARRGRLHGFRWRDRMDWKSCPPMQTASVLDQALGTGDGARTQFQLTKRYGDSAAHWLRPIVKPVAGSVRVAVGGTELGSGGFTVNTASGVLTLTAPPPTDAAVTAGFHFDVPARFDTDRLSINLASFQAGDAPSVPVIEILT